MVQMLPIDYQAGVMAEVGDPNGTLAPLLDSVWAMYSGMASDPRIVALYVKRALLDVRLAELQREITVSIDGRRADRAQLFDHAAQMRQTTHEEILRLETRARGRRAPVAGALTTTAPTSPPSPWGPDRNADSYRGDPYSPLRRNQ
jgi:hypothetical protein